MQPPVRERQPGHQCPAAPFDEHRALDGEPVLRPRHGDVPRRGGKVLRDQVAGGDDAVSPVPDALGGEISRHEEEHLRRKGERAPLDPQPLGPQASGDVRRRPAPEVRQDPLDSDGAVPPRVNPRERGPGRDRRHHDANARLEETDARPEERESRERGRASSTAGGPADEQKKAAAGQGGRACGAGPRSRPEQDPAGEEGRRRGRRGRAGTGDRFAQSAPAESATTASTR